MSCALAALLATNMGGCPFFLGLLGWGATPDTGNTGGGDTGGGDTGGGDTGGGDTGGGTTTVSIVKTNISVRHDAGLQCGDDVIAFGTGTLNGVSYVIPSAGDTTARAIPNDTDYDSGAFDCSGGTIWLVGGVSSSMAFQVSVFDVATASITKAYAATEISLPNIQDPGSPGNIRADGNYCVVRCDTNDVTDGKMIKVIDVSSGTPVLTAFDVNPAGAGSASQVADVDVDAATKRVVAVVGDDIYVYDINNPTTAPTMYTIGAGYGLADSHQAHISGDYLFCGIEQSTASPHAALVNLTNGTVTETDVPDSAGDYGIGGTKYLFFASDTAADSVGAQLRTAVGTVPNAANTKATLGLAIDGSTNNNGLFGFAQTVCITPDGAYLFIAGKTSLGSGEFLQWSTGGGTWTLPADPDASSQYGVPATDVDCSNDCVAFKSGAGTTAGTSTVLAYAVLP